MVLLLADSRLPFLVNSLFRNPSSHILNMEHNLHTYGGCICAVWRHCAQMWRLFASDRQAAPGVQLHIL